MAIGAKGWAPQRGGTPIRIIRFADSLLEEGIETHVIEGVAVRIFGAARTVADCFRHRGKVGLSVAIEGPPLPAQHVCISKMSRSNDSGAPIWKTWAKETKR